MCPVLFAGEGNIVAGNSGVRADFHENETLFFLHDDATAYTALIIRRFHLQ
jgi:hypothetical protein